MVGIVILNYNSSDMVMKLVRKISSYAHISDIVVIDNCSLSDEYEKIKMVENVAPHVHLICSKDNRGYAAGNNIGLRYLIDQRKVENVAIVNPDVVFSDELVVAVENMFASRPQYGMLTGWSLNAEGEPSPHPYWRPSSYFEHVLIVATHGRWQPAQPYKPVSPIFDVGAIEGCLMFIRSKALVECGYLDEHTFLFFEEDILCSRMRQLGWRIGVLRDISFIHDHHRSTTEASAFSKMSKILEESRRYYARTILHANTAQIALLYVLSYWGRLLYYGYQPVKCLMREIQKALMSIRGGQKDI